MSAQKIRLTYRKGNRLRFLAHLDVLRAIERAIRRAGLPLAYSEGFTPHPRLAFAGPLPLGFEGEAEIVDVTLTERVPVAEAVERVRRCSSDDLQPTSGIEVPLRSPSPQAAARWADYRVDLPGVGAVEAGKRAGRFLEATAFEWTETRQNKKRTYDLRALVGWIRTGVRPGGGSTLTMRLSAGNDATARPEQVVAAVFPEAEAAGFTRLRIILEDESAARRAWKRTGQYI